MLLLLLLLLIELGNSLHTAVSTQSSQAIADVPATSEVLSWSYELNLMPWLSTPESLDYCTYEPYSLNL